MPQEVSQNGDEEVCSLKHSGTSKLHADWNSLTAQNEREKLPINFETQFITASKSVQRASFCSPNPSPQNGSIVCIFLLGITRLN